MKSRTSPLITSSVLRDSREEETGNIYMFFRKISQNSGHYVRLSHARLCPVGKCDEKKKEKKEKKEEERNPHSCFLPPPPSVLKKIMRDSARPYRHGTKWEGRDRGKRRYGLIDPRSHSLQKLIQI